MSFLTMMLTISQLLFVFSQGNVGSQGPPGPVGERGEKVCQCFKLLNNDLHFCCRIPHEIDERGDFSTRPIKHEYAGCSQ